MHYLLTVSFFHKSAFMQDYDVIKTRLTTGDMRKEHVNGAKVIVDLYMTRPGRILIEI